MIWEDDKMLSLFRLAFSCSYCRQPTPGGTDPCHVITRGVGGGTRLDVPLNLVSLCRTCHNENHAGRSPTREELCELVGERYGYKSHEVLARLHRMIRAPKEARPCRDCEGAGRLMDQKLCHSYQCPTCRGVGILFRGRPWREPRRRFAGS